MVTPETLSMVLMALKDAGVRRCRMGDFEVEFEPDVADEATPTAQSTPPTKLAIVGAPTPVRPGYSSLFGPNTPGFMPNADPTPSAE